MIDPRRAARESGAILIIFMVAIAVGAIALTAAAQAWSTTWRRDSEEELIFRANQYVLGIIAYRKEHGGQFPLRLEDLNKPGPRRLRYVRKLYKDPLAKDGKWGLLYLMPGGQGVYDPKAAQVAQDKAKKEWGKGWESAGTGNPGQMPGVTPLNQNPMGTGVPGTGGMPPGSLPPGMSGTMPMIPQQGGMGGGRRAAAVGGRGERDRAADRLADRRSHQPRHRQGGGGHLQDLQGARAGGRMAVPRLRPGRADAGPRQSEPRPGRPGIRRPRLRRPRRHGGRRFGSAAGIVERPRRECARVHAAGLRGRPRQELQSPGSLRKQSELQPPGSVRQLSEQLLSARDRSAEAAGGAGSGR